MINIEKQFITIKEISTVIDVSVPTINRWIRNNYIPSYKIGKRRLFKKEEIDNWIEGHKYVNQKSL